MTVTPRQARAVAALKSGDGGDPSLPIAGWAGVRLGRLVAVGPAVAGSEVVVRALCRWREENRDWFLSVVPPDPDRTRAYLANKATPEPDRILFLIEDEEGRLVGHAGLRGICATGAELDNVLRGEPVEGVGFMVAAVGVLLGWAFSALEVPSIHLAVLAHNTRAIRTYGRLGFRPTERRPLWRRPVEGGYRLVPDEAPEGEPTDLWLSRMQLDPGTFHALRPGAAGPRSAG